MSRGRVAAWLIVLAPIWPLLVALWLRQHASFPLYAHANPLVATWVFGLGYAAALYLVSLPFGNASIFDVHWSVLPSIYVIHYALHPSSHPDPVREVLVIGCVWIWSLRLTGNWLKKGGLGFEDFRYESYRTKMSPLVFQLFAFTALFLVQSAMVVTMSMPTYVALRAPGNPVGALDVIATIVVLFGVAFEWIADLQGMAFREQREANRALHPEDYEGVSPRAARFPQQGLWSWSRHPNYFGEICVWWGVWLFSVAQSGHWLSWMLLGPLTINGLFVGGSIGITEAHELSRKPEYADYQRRVSRLIPLPPRR